MCGWRYENLSGKMTTLFSAVELVLEMNSGCARLGEQFCQLHDSRGAAVTGKL